jgi:hypothetical protein
MLPHQELLNMVAVQVLVHVFLVSKGFEVEAIDISDIAIELVKQLAYERGFQIHLC